MKKNLVDYFVVRNYLPTAFNTTFQQQRVEILETS